MKIKSYNTNASLSTIKDIFSERDNNIFEFESFPKKSVILKYQEEGKERKISLYLSQYHKLFFVISTFIFLVISVLYIKTLSVLSLFFILFLIIFCSTIKSDIKKYERKLTQSDVKLW